MDVHKPNVVVLFEPKFSGVRAEQVCKNLGFDDRTRVDAVGFSSSIWVMWNQNQIETNRVEASDQFIQFVCKSDDMGEFMITTVYGKPSALGRMQLWDDLSRISIGVQRPWVLAGDFNAMLSPTDKRGRVPLGPNQTTSFLNCCHVCGISVLQPVGPKFTWYRRLVAERIDWGLASVEWGKRFPGYKAYHLPKLYSDHQPVLLKDPNAGRVRLPRPFRFIAAWLNHDAFDEVLKSEWQHSAAFPIKITSLATKLKTWNKTTFGNIFERKKKEMEKIVTLEGDLESDPTEVKQHELVEARLRLEKTLWQKEFLWIQKARSKASIEGDRNTKFFHNSMVRRREFNRVSRLMNEAGEWIEEEPVLMQMAVDFFTDLYTNAGPTREVVEFPPLLASRRLKL
ncbi:hypothetical protein LINGRAHAP2_LOCUS23147 [Linum grandiflorum]